MQRGGDFVPELPLALAAATLVAGRLEFRLRAEDPRLVVRAARLLGPAGAAAIQVAGPGLLQCPVPHAGGRLILSVEAVEPLDESWPALPWEYPLFLPDVAVSDYHAAATCGAVLTLPYGESLLVDRVLRRMGRTLVYADWRVTGRGRRWWPPTVTSLRAGTQVFAAEEAPYRYGDPDHPDDTPVHIQAFCFQGVPLDRPLTLVFRNLALHVPGEWSADLTVPPGRPAAVRCGQSVSVGTVTLTLEEVWLGLSQTVVVFRSDFPAQPDTQALCLLDASSRRYGPRGSQSNTGDSEAQFEAIPPGQEQLRISGDGLILQFKDEVSLPLSAGSRASAVPAPSDKPRRYAVTSDWFPVLLPAAAPRPTRPAAPDALAAVQGWVRDRLVPAARLQFRRSPAESLDPAGSRLGGPALLPAGQTWPQCGRCQRPLTHVAQIGSDSGLLTFFYCFGCRPMGPEGAAGYRIWLLDKDQAVPCDEPRAASSRGPVPCSVQLVPVSSAPQWDDARISLDHLDLGSDPWETYHDVWSDLTGSATLESRLGGFPDWIQGAQWPTCPACAQRMNLLLQLDSEPETGLMWGDSGRVFLFRCGTPTHPPEVALVLQSC